MFCSRLRIVGPEDPRPGSRPEVHHRGRQEAPLDEGRSAQNGEYGFQDEEKVANLVTQPSLSFLPAAKPAGQWITKSRSEEEELRYAF